MQPNLRAIHILSGVVIPDTSIRKSQYIQDMLLNRRLLIQIVTYDGIISLGAHASNRFKFQHASNQ
jgi:hypothetical protein